MRPERRLPCSSARAARRARDWPRRKRPTRPTRMIHGGRLLVFERASSSSSSSLEGRPRVVCIPREPRLARSSSNHIPQLVANLAAAPVPPDDHWLSAGCPLASRGSSAPAASQIFGSGPIFPLPQVHVPALGSPGHSRESPPRRSPRHSGRHGLAGPTDERDCLWGDKTNFGWTRIECCRPHALCGQHIWAPEAARVQRGRKERKRESGARKVGAAKTERKSKSGRPLLLLLARRKL